MVSPSSLSEHKQFAEDVIAHDHKHSGHAFGDQICAEGDIYHRQGDRFIGDRLQKRHDAKGEDGIQNQCGHPGQRKFPQFS